MKTTHGKIPRQTWDLNLLGGAVWILPGVAKILLTTSPWPAPARVHPNIALLCGAHAGSTKVLATKGSSKTPTVYAGFASAVAFMGPKRRRPPVFYFSSMMAADTEKLAIDSSLSTHPASVSACMALPQAREARP